MERFRKRYATSQNPTKLMSTKPSLHGTSERFVILLVKTNSGTKPDRIERSFNYGTKQYVTLNRVLYYLQKRSRKYRPLGIILKKQFDYYFLYYLSDVIDAEFTR